LNKQVDILVGSPPCQAVSIANRRNMHNSEEGSLLYLNFLRFLKCYKPKLFVLENVVGLLSYRLKDGSKLIDTMIKEFSVDYSVKVFKVCCSDFSVPQKRKRIIIIGVKKEFRLTFPDLKKYPCNKSLRYFLLDKKDVPESYFLSKKAISGILRRKLSNSINGNGFGANYLNMDGFCNTITASYWKDGYSSLIKYSESEVRRLTEIELKRIQSFPDTFYIFGSKKDRYIQIGNAVPPNLGYFLGKEIIEFLEKL
jgi:DNA (cytosine-5)-methyltransferase 1